MNLLEVRKRFLKGRAKPALGLMLGWQDVLQAYRRSRLGQFWITLGMGFQIATMGLVFGLIFKTDTVEYLPFLAISITIWGLIASILNEGCMTFISNESLIKQLNLPHFQYVVRVLWKNIVTAGHNFLIVPIVMIIFNKGINISIISVIPGLVLLFANLAWVVWLLGTVSARFRDFPPIVSSLTTVIFFLTPVMWLPNLLGNASLAHLLLGLNPIYHWIQIIRQPILGSWPTTENWIGAIVTAVIGWIVLVRVNSKYRNMIAYWM